MHRTFTVWIVAAGWLLCVGAAMAAGDASKGKAVYDKSCAVCHGPQGKGDGPAGKALSPPAGDFTSEASKKKSEGDMLRVIREGKPGTAMVGWSNTLSEEDIRNVLAYVLTLRK